MRKLAVPKLARTSSRRAVGWLLLGSLLLSVIGVPVPQRKRVAGDAPFPCQDRPCGCATAEACWQHCCCFSENEKLAWAREHGVTPPQYVVQAALAETVSAAATEVASANRPMCCRERSGPVSEETAESGCTTPTHGVAAVAKPAEVETAEVVEGATTLVLMEAYQRCRGLASIFKQLTEHWTPPAEPQLGVAATLLFRIAAVDQRPIERPQSPEPPVP